MTGRRSWSIIRDIFHDVPDLAVQDPAKHLDGVGADAFVSFQASDLSGADVVQLDGGVLGDAFFLHHFP